MRIVQIWSLLLVAVWCSAAAAEPEYPQIGPDVYDTKADAEVDIAAALKKAKASNKRVLLDFGANWCGWCRKLHEMFTTNDNVKKVLDANYLVVAIDVNQRDGAMRNAQVVERYGNPVKHGLPVLVVLDADGKQLHTQDTALLESGKAHDEAKVLAFLNQWAPARQ